ncbi:hypothetical protein Bra1253DRAFT_00197 [Bradyrhizobium sp. WSM1253]|nr:hypothetical protein Bra1253DRAFT_00197 [Bradyrhizobium sp. WSM1253]
MNTRVGLTAVKQSIVVEAPIARAFKIFTEGFGSFKPPEHNLLRVQIAETVFEPRVGGYIMTEASMGASAAGRACWPTNRRTGCCSAGTSAPNGRSRLTRKKPASGRSGSLLKRRTGPESTLSTATWNAMAMAGKPCGTVSTVIKAGRFIYGAMPIFSPRFLTEVPRSALIEAISKDDCFWPPSTR